jgi:hypothetical protein
MIDYKTTSNSELVFSTVGGIGVDHTRVTDLISDRLRKYSYALTRIRVSVDILPWLSKAVAPSPPPRGTVEYAAWLMNAGDSARNKYADAGIVALAAAREINRRRDRNDVGDYLIGRNAYLITSLKRPEEVAYLRDLYG